MPRPRCNLAAGAALLAALAAVLGGCSDPAASDVAASSSSESRSPAPPPPSTWVSPNDAQSMLERNAPLEDLRADLTRNLGLLDTVRVELHDPNQLGKGYVVLDVDYVGNCSGTIHFPDGTDLRIITRGKLSVTTTDDGPVGDALDGRWAKADKQQETAAFCGKGAAAFVDQRDQDHYWTWLLDGGRKVGMEDVRGHSALHVRQRQGSTVYDIWVAAFENPQNPTDHDLYPVKITSRDGDGVSTDYYSRFNTAVVEKLPPRSRILDPGAVRA